MMKYLGLKYSRLLKGNENMIGSAHLFHEHFYELSLLENGMMYNRIHIVKL